MAETQDWAACRVAFVETARAVQLTGVPVAALRADWQTFTVVEVDQGLCETAVDLAREHDLRTLDALHLAAALAVAGPGLRLATWDHRLWNAARHRGLAVLPSDLP